MRELERVTFITHWGWRRPHIHRPGVDVVVPPMLKVAQLIDESPYLHPERNARPGTEYRYLLSFVGSVRPHTPGYSFGVRQAVFARYANDTRFFLRDARGESKAPRSRRDRAEIARRSRPLRHCVEATLECRRCGRRSTVRRRPIRSRRWSD